METDRLATHPDADIQMLEVTIVFFENMSLQMLALLRVDVLTTRGETNFLVFQYVCIFSIHYRSAWNWLEMCAWISCYTLSAVLNVLYHVFIVSPTSIHRKSKGLHLLINLFTVKVKELNGRVCHYTQGIWSYINPQSNEVEERHTCSPRPDPPPFLFFPCLW